MNYYDTGWLQPCLVSSLKNDNTMKFEYTEPKTSVITLKTEENLAQFIISSHAVGENEGLAKPGFFIENDETAQTDSYPIGFDAWDK